MGKQAKHPESVALGEQIKSDDMVVVSVRVPRAVRRRWAIAAHELDSTMIELVTNSVDRYLAKQAKKRSREAGVPPFAV